MKNVGITWQVGDGFGWGIFGINFVLELIRNWNTTPVLYERIGRIDLSENAINLLNQCKFDYIPNDVINQNKHIKTVEFPVFYSGGNYFQHDF